MIIAILRSKLEPHKVNYANNIVTRRIVKDEYVLIDSSRNLNIDIVPDENLLSVNETKKSSDSKSVLGNLLNKEMLQID